MEHKCWHVQGKRARTAVREKLPEVAVQLKMGPTRFISEMARNSPLLFVLYPPEHPNDRRYSSGCWVLETASGREIENQENLHMNTFFICSIQVVLD